MKNWDHGRDFPYLYQLGISMLESALCFVLFSSLLLMGASLWNYIEVSNALTLIADRYVSEGGKGLYLYDKNKGRFVADITNLKQAYLDNLTSGNPSTSGLARRAIKELTTELQGAEESQIRLDFAFVVVPIDPRSGEVRGIPALDSSDIVVSGELSVPIFLIDGDSHNGEANLTSAIVEYVKSSADSLAIPTQSFGVGSSSSRFLPEVPVIAVRAIYRFDHAKTLKTFGLIDEPYAWDIKVTALRGEVG